MGFTILAQPTGRGYPQAQPNVSRLLLRTKGTYFVYTNSNEWPLTMISCGVIKQTDLYVVK